MLIADILKSKRQDIVAMPETYSLAEAAKVMTRQQVGAIVITSQLGRLEGLLAEREIVAALAHGGASALRGPIGNWMRRNVVTTSPDAGVYEAMMSITRARARHLPVLENGRVVGLLSVGDLLKSRLDEKTQENLVLMDVARWPRAALG